MGWSYLAAALLEAGLALWGPFAVPLDRLQYCDGLYGVLVAAHLAAGVILLLRGRTSGAHAARRLPVLSTFLGHVHVADTYWYLSAWPELMSQAMARLERRWEPAR